jgi:hypothetical protein
MQPKFYISYSPDKLGHVFALLEFGADADIYGWHLEAKNHYFSAAFFMIENFYADRATRLYRSIPDDVYGPWTVDYPPSKGEIRPPAPEWIGHELERLQSRFVEEWLLFEDDPHIEAETSAYLMRGLHLQAVNIRSKRLSRMERNGRTWTYMTPGMDINVVELLRKYWRLSDKVPPYQ